MDKTVYIAPLKKEMFLGDMLQKLSMGNNMTLDGAVVVHGNGIWDRQIWESSPRHPSGRKLGDFEGIRFPLEARWAIDSTGLVIYAEKYRTSVSRALRDHGYNVVNLSY